MLESEYEISTTFIQELRNTLRDILTQPQFPSVSEYKLIKLLQSERYNTLNNLNMNQSEQLFQLHFLVFHALYQLQQELLSQGVGLLQITPLAICVTSIPLNDKPNSSLQEQDKLAEYYLDLDNLTNTTAEDIEQLILSFWKSFNQPNSHLESLKILQLKPPVTYSEIKKQYKRLASQHHPDKGGSKESIQQINQAMATINRHHRNGQLTNIS